MFPSVLRRPALGQVASLGSLYDARSDTFIPLSLLKTAPPAGAVGTIQKHSTDLKFSKTDTYKEKFDHLGVQAELSASFLAGLVNVEGSGRYLTDKRESNLVVQSSMHYSITTVEDELNLTAKDLKECLAFETLESDIATHVVIGISWGAHCVVTAKSQVGFSQDKSQVAGNLKAQLNCLKILGLGTNGGASVAKDRGEQSAEYHSEVTIYGDVLADDGLVPTDFKSAQRFISNVHKYISMSNDGKGKPTAYTLMPLSLLATFRILELKADIIFQQLSIECLEKFTQLFDDLRDAQQTLHDYYLRIRQHQSAIPPNHTRIVADQLSNARAVEASLKADYARLLKDVRAGKADGDQLWQLLDKFLNGEMPASKIKSSATYAEKVEFVDLIALEGAHYVGYQGTSVDTVLMGNPHDDAFVLYFDDSLRHNSVLWKDNVALLLELLRDKATEKMVLVVDCEAIDTPVDSPHICHTRNGRLLSDDVVEQRKTLAANCIMRCNESTINRSITSKPLQRRAVKIACPQPYCDRTLRCNWICTTCESLVEYGYIDDRLYCNCGSSPYHQWEFKCKNPRHGSAWARYDDSVLLKLLRALEPFEELNILILGETGVGKSTWINAFMNYLTYDTLDEALGAEELRWVIPCSFSTQLKDESNKRGKDVQLLQRDIKIGTSKTEKNGAHGQSATQQTLVYAINIGNTRVRLIDTPGIGDTRGVEQDNKNMADILRVLRSYNQLHGILILFKPNAARLTVMFKFCIKQLLTHLHRDAANNIVFGFTNTRGSNYKPGDTFKPLESLLLEYKKIQMGLFEHNVYCFDSESFRYLAARKRGVDMGLLEDNTRSWEYSVTECKRLVKHFQGLKPHMVRSTINLNETRSIIVQLTEPMALLAQKIQISIQVNDDQIKELQSKRLSRDQLKQSLYAQKESLCSSPVDEPRTACTHPSCVEYRSEFAGRNEMTIIYKTMCHKPCGLGGSVTRNQKGHPMLENCAAIGSDGLCRECGHHWMDHMHIYIDYKNTTYKYRDEDVYRDLIKFASDIELKQAAIEMKKTAIAEYKLEHQQVQEAAIQFGFFLKRHAITPYNDATLDYVDHLIDQEKMKIQNGGEKKDLEMLEKYRAEHVQGVQTLTRAMEIGDDGEVLDDQGVRQLIDSLYGLPHFGEDLKEIVATNERAAEATFREQSFNVSAGAHWNRNAHTKLNRAQKRGPAGYAALQNVTPGTFPGLVPGAFPETSSSGYRQAVLPNEQGWISIGKLPDTKKPTPKRFWLF